MYSGCLVRSSARSGSPVARAIASSSRTLGGVFRYSTTFGSTPCSRSSSSALREVLQRGL